MKYAKKNNFNPFLCRMAHIQTFLVSFVKSKIKSFVYRFHDNFLFDVFETIFTSVFSLHSIWDSAFSQISNHPTPLFIVTCVLQVKQRYIWISVFAPILTILAFTIFSNDEAFSSSLVHSMEILLLFSVTVDDSVDFKMRLFITFWIFIFFKS